MQNDLEWVLLCFPRKITGAFPDTCHLKMEAEPASEAFCFVCTSDVGHSPREELLLKSVSVSLFALKLSTTVCDVCSVVSDPYCWSAVFLNKYWKHGERKTTKDASQYLLYKIQPPLRACFC